MIPKIIHQIWIGPHPAPTADIQTWIDAHPGWEHRLWTDERGWRNQAQIDAMNEWNGKADIMRYEILERFGGIALDADSRCVRPLAPKFLAMDLWTAWENETVRDGLVACGAIGCAPGHPLLRACVDAIELLTGDDLTRPAWKCVGPLFWSKQIAAWEEGSANRCITFPARHFYPMHYSGTPAQGDAEIYAEQDWASTAIRDDGRVARTPARRGRLSPITVIVTGGARIERELFKCLASLAMQTVPVHVAGFFNARESAEAFDRARELFGLEGSVWHGEEWAQAEALRYARELPPSAVVAWVDGDDWLTRVDAFEIVWREYDLGAWMTFGNLAWADPEACPFRPTFGSFPDEVVQNGSYRDWKWNGVVLRTFRAGLLQRVPPEQFVDPDSGEFYRLSFDHALMFPLLELAGTNAHWIEERLYFYNWQHTGSSISRGTDYCRRQLDEARRIRARERLAPLRERPW